MERARVVAAEENIRAGYTAVTHFTLLSAQAEFYSGLFWPTASGATVWGPKPGRLLAKLFFTLDPRGSDPAKALGIARAIAEGLMVSCNHIPVLNAALVSVLRITRRADPLIPIDRKELYIRTTKAHAPHPEYTPLFFVMRYGLAWGHFAALSEELLAIDQLPARIQSLALTRMLEVDLGREAATRFGE
jgi:hypothetical protein